jgi:UDP-N-acetylglucosamine--N-acetylmuramyl-(pentapeptide) pyrophosphoryl-undecaprenol N-acetylglucosamine transferase
LIFISAGGTGGGIYPALAVASAIRSQSPQTRLAFIGSGQALDRELIAATATQFESLHTVQAGPLHGVPPLQALVSLGRLALGLMQALALCGRWRPQAVFLTGGWVGVPMALAAWLWRVPIAIFVPDIEPGLTLKVLGRFARLITATTDQTAAFFPRKTVLVTGYPLRPALLTASRAEAQAHFALDPARPTLLIFGGSRGARSLNTATLAHISTLLAQTPAQVLHVTGTLDWETVQTAYQALPAEVRARYQIFPYLHDLGLAMAGADVVLSRAGASILGEFPHFGLPSVLVPYPHAWRYQRVNAEYLLKAGAALLVEDGALMTELLPTLQSLLSDPARLQAMSAAAARLHKGDGAGRIAAAVLALSAGKAPFANQPPPMA